MPRPGMTMSSLTEIVKAITLNNKLDESRNLGGARPAGNGCAPGRTSKDVRNHGVKQAPFVVLIGASMPSVLVEISFITHPQEGRLLKSGAYRQKIAEALFDAVRGYQKSLKGTAGADPTVARGTIADGDACRSAPARHAHHRQGGWRAAEGHRRHRHHLRLARHYRIDARRVRVCWALSSGCSSSGCAIAMSADEPVHAPSSAYGFTPSTVGRSRIRGLSRAKAVPQPGHAYRGSSERTRLQAVRLVSRTASSPDSPACARQPRSGPWRR